ncbi:hypothetical protein BCR41DRAFT_386652 [Lobosporangium transversale]|uniref:Uncharacterized protein n=1 Tax=Lobosporangium transversale TaxID=64571 RepID=A0A1Y2GMP0_9FUNG|nr:hypothetical protein BCR41DRAFT_386652 [Lobosporangium transversale]ORZ15547.1 hypothetical protein BCR41DRAFT_386652 [Lobosporangium transversale]|eukprot:XP_021881295.1 hypothetical protein BCR41DRAFT_386652 [Lobosporangium transversale]
MTRKMEEPCLIMIKEDLGMLGWSTSPRKYICLVAAENAIRPAFNTNREMGPWRQTNEKGVNLRTYSTFSSMTSTSFSWILVRACMFEFIKRQKEQWNEGIRVTISCVMLGTNPHPIDLIFVGNGECSCMKHNDINALPLFSLGGSLEAWNLSFGAFLILIMFELIDNVIVFVPGRTETIGKNYCSTVHFCFHKSCCFP